MNTQTYDAKALSNGARDVLVAPDTGRKPKIVARLRDWEYIEHSLMRLIAGWARYFPEWEDKVACHRHIWEQAECVQRLRERQAQFPGTSGNLDAPVSKKLERLVNTVLQAPSHEDAVDGIHSVLLGALMNAYLDYRARAHPVHDAPTLATLHQVVGIKESMRLWLRDYRRRHPHEINKDYREAIARAMEDCGQLHEALPVESEAAKPCGVDTPFRLPARPARPEGTAPRYDITPYLEADFETSVEARRLFWCYGYLLEMNLAEDMPRMIWAGHFMPWEYQHKLARHLWDESRHGDSGRSRLLDFGITLQEIGFPAYSGDPRGLRGDDGEIGYQENMTPEELCEGAFFLGMVPETGHFTVKNEAYQDFKAGGDLESAEMMIFDIIDEGAHVQYCHEWLPELALRTGVDMGDYRTRATGIRAEYQHQTDARVEAARLLPRDESNPTFVFYQHLLQRIREKQPLSNASTCLPRTAKPM